MTGLVVALIVCIFICVFGFALMVYDVPFGEIFFAIGLGFSVVFFVVLMVEGGSKAYLKNNGPDYTELNNYQIIIASYNEKEDKGNLVPFYNELIDNVNKYNEALEDIYRLYKFYELTVPDEVKNYSYIYYDYENNLAKWENGGGIVTW